MSSSSIGTKGVWFEGCAVRIEGQLASPLELFACEIWILVIGYLPTAKSCLRLSAASRWFRYGDLREELVARVLALEPLRSLSEFAVCDQLLRLEMDSPTHSTKVSAQESNSAVHVDGTPHSLPTEIVAALSLHKSIDGFLRQALGLEPPRYTDVFSEWEWYDPRLPDDELFVLQDTWERKMGGARGRSRARDHVEWTGAYSRMGAELKRDLCIVWALAGKLFPFTKTENSEWRERRKAAGGGNAGCWTPVGKSKKGKKPETVVPPSPSATSKRGSRNSSKVSCGRKQWNDEEFAEDDWAILSMRNSKPPKSPSSKYLSTSAPTGLNVSEVANAESLREKRRQSALNIPVAQRPTGIHSQQPVSSPSLRDSCSSSSSSATLLELPSPLLLTNSPSPRSILRKSSPNAMGSGRSFQNSHLFNMTEVANMAPPFDLDHCSPVMNASVKKVEDGSITPKCRENAGDSFESSPFFTMDDLGDVKYFEGVAVSVTRGRVPVGNDGVSSAGNTPILSRKQQRVLKKRGGISVLKQDQDVIE